LSASRNSSQAARRGPRARSGPGSLTTARPPLLCLQTQAGRVAKSRKGAQGNSANCRMTAGGLIRLPLDLARHARMIRWRKDRLSIRPSAPYLHMSHRAVERVLNTLASS
jgi:hypothetical protein